MYNDTVLCPSDLVFNNEAYWFGHPCLSQTGTLGYGDAWENETMTIIDVDMTELTGDFVSLSFEYYADTFYEVDSQGNIEPSDYLASQSISRRMPENTPVLFMASGMTTMKMEHVKLMRMAMV